jgi:hypothetical protein
MCEVLWIDIYSPVYMHVCIIRGRNIFVGDWFKEYGSTQSCVFHKMKCILCKKYVLRRELYICYYNHFFITTER